MRLAAELWNIMSKIFSPSKSLGPAEALRVRLQLVAMAVLTGFSLTIYLSSFITHIPAAFLRRHFTSIVLGFPLFLLMKTKYYRVCFLAAFLLGATSLVRQAISQLNAGDLIEFYPAYSSHLVSAVVSGAFLFPFSHVLLIAGIYLFGTGSFFYFCPDVPQSALEVMFYGVLSSMMPCLVYSSLAWYIQTLLIRQTDELQKARDEALEASTLKSQFVATMSHEIRTPLNGVIGLTEMLLRTQLNNDQRHWVENVQTSGRVLLALANQVLDFSRIEAGKVEIRSEEVNLRRVIEDVVQVCGITTRDDVDMVSYVDPQLPETVVGDDTRIQQILVNLVGNASKFTHEGQVQVRAELVSPSDARTQLGESSTTVPEDSCFVRIAVRDSGIGLTKDQAQRLFQPFTQADSSTTRRYGGSGLGLVIAQRLASLMDGRIDLTSEYGKGSEFSAVIRVAKRQESKTASALCEVLGNQRIMVLCSKEAVAESYVALLRSMGAIVSSLVIPPSVVDMSLLSELVDKSSLSADANLFVLDASVIMRSCAPCATLLGRTLINIISRHVEVQEDCSALVLRKPFRSQDLASIILRISRPSSAHVDSVVTHAPVDQMDSLNLAGHRVLLAEDYLVNQMVMKLMLGKLGCEVDIADDGLIAFSKYKASLSDAPYSAILMDMQMPVMDGLQSTKAIRTHEDELGLPVGKRIPILAVTATALGDDSMFCKENGMQGYVCKPISLESLRSTLARVLKSEM